MKKFVASVLERDQKEEEVTWSRSSGTSPAAESIAEHVESLYIEYRQCFESRNMGRVFAIIKTIEESKSDSPLLNLMRGEIYLYVGDGDRSYEELQYYINNATIIDSYGMAVIALWNQAAGHSSESLSQHCESLRDNIDPRRCVRTLLNAVHNKKRMRFLDGALEYYKRILALPEGYAMIPYILLEMIHLHILKKNFAEARSEIASYERHGSNTFLSRLSASVNYFTGEFDSILKKSHDTPSDPFISYLIGRIALEKGIQEIDSEHFLTKAAKKSKDNPHVYATRGNCLFLNGNPSAALDDYERALKIDPNLEYIKKNRQIVEQAMEKGYKATSKNIMSQISDIEPDVEALGFFYTYELFGYAPFRISRDVRKKLAIYKNIYSMGY